MLVSIGEFRQQLGGVELNEGQRAHAERLLSGTQAALELWLNRPVEPVYVREFAYSDGTGFVRLSVSPVSKVLAVTQTAEYSDSPLIYETVPMKRPANLDETIREFSTMGANGISYRAQPGGIKIPSSSAYVHYIGGLDHYASMAIKIKILEIAARSFVADNIHTVGMREGSPEPADNPVGAVGWTYDELLSFDRLRRRVIR